MDERAQSVLPTQTQASEAYQQALLDVRLSPGPLSDEEEEEITQKLNKSIENPSYTVRENRGRLARSTENLAKVGTLFGPSDGNEDVDVAATLKYRTLDTLTSPAGYYKNLDVAIKTTRPSESTVATKLISFPALSIATALVSGGRRLSRCNYVEGNTNNNAGQSGQEMSPNLLTDFYAGSVACSIPGSIGSSVANSAVSSVAGSDPNAFESGTADQKVNVLTESHRRQECNYAHGNIDNNAGQCDQSGNDQQETDGLCVQIKCDENEVDIITEPYGNHKWKENTNNKVRRHERGTQNELRSASSIGLNLQIGCDENEVDKLREPYRRSKSLLSSRRPSKHQQLKAKVLLKQLRLLDETDDAQTGELKNTHLHSYRDQSSSFTDSDVLTTDLDALKTRSDSLRTYSDSFRTCLDSRTNFDSSKTQLDSVKTHADSFEVHSYSFETHLDSSAAHVKSLQHCSDSSKTQSGSFTAAKPVPNEFYDQYANRNIYSARKRASRTKDRTVNTCHKYCISSVSKVDIDLKQNETSNRNSKTSQKHDDTANRQSDKTQNKDVLSKKDTKKRRLKKSGNKTHSPSMSSKEKSHKVSSFVPGFINITNRIDQLRTHDYNVKSKGSMGGKHDESHRNIVKCEPYTARVEYSDLHPKEPGSFETRRIPRKQPLPGLKHASRKKQCRHTMSVSSDNIYNSSDKARYCDTAAAATGRDMSRSLPVLNLKTLGPDDKAGDQAKKVDDLGNKGVSVTFIRPKSAPNLNKLQVQPSSLTSVSMGSLSGLNKGKSDQSKQSLSPTRLLDSHIQGKRLPLMTRCSSQGHRSGTPMSRSPGSQRSQSPRRHTTLGLVPDIVVSGDQSSSSEESESEEEETEDEEEEDCSESGHYLVIPSCRYEKADQD